MGEVLYNITFFIHIVILLLIFHQVSGVNLSKKWFIFAPLLLRFLFFIAPVIAYFVTLLFWCYILCIEMIFIIGC